MKKIIFALLLITSAAFSYSKSTEETIKKALLLYQAMHSGNYTIVCTGSSVTNKMHRLEIKIIAAGNTFNGSLQFPVQKINEKKNHVNFLIGNISGVQYGRVLIYGITVNAGFFIQENNSLICAGIGIVF